MFLLSPAMTSRASTVFPGVFPCGRVTSRPAYVRDLKHIGGYSLSTRLMYVWFDR